MVSNITVRGSRGASMNQSLHGFLLNTDLCSSLKRGAEIIT